jgi:hypothetical protein
MIVEKRFSVFEFVKLKSVVLVSKAAELDENLFYCPRLKKKFQFDHIRQTASAPVDHPSTAPADAEKFRSELDKVFNDYVVDHYPQGVSAVYHQQQGYVLLLVSNKYNPGNFW